MLSAEKLTAQIDAYASGNISLGAFEDWFYESSIEPIPDEVEEASERVDEALSDYHFQKLSQSRLRSMLKEVAGDIALPGKSHVEVVEWGTPKRIPAATASKKSIRVEGDRIDRFGQDARVTSDVVGRFPHNTGSASELLSLSVSA